MAPTQEGQGQPELEVAEQEVAEGGGPDERDGLDEVGADEGLGRQHRVEQQQQDDDQRARADRGQADHQAAEETDGDGEDGPDPDLIDRGDRLAAPALVDDVLGDHRGGGQEEGDAEHHLQAVLELLAGVEGVEEEHAAEGGRDRADAEEQDQAPVDGAVAHVDAGADGLHHQRGHEVARDRGEGLDTEDQHHDRRHERAPAHAGEADDEADDEACDGDEHGGHPAPRSVAGNRSPVETAPNRSMSRRFAELRGRFLTERVIRALRDPSR